MSENSHLRHENYKGISGLTYCLNFLDQDSQTELINEIDNQTWSTSLKRRVQHYGYRYDYTLRTITSDMFLGDLPSFLQKIAIRLYDEEYVKDLPDQAIINEYKPGQGIYPHIDCEPCFGEEIVTISLISEYPLSMIKDGVEIHVPLPVGSCLILAGDARHLWKHGIRARKFDNKKPRGRRISITFRKAILPS